MASRRSDRDTDTLTRVDEVADAKTIKQHRIDPDAPTHKVDPRVWAPLRVCPQCSLAWESSGDWCPSCGTAFDQRRRPRRGDTRRAAVTRVQTGGPRRSRPAPARAAQSPAPQRSGAGKVLATVLLFAAAVAFAFVLGQQTRQSADEVDRQIESAVQQTKDSAVASFRRSFEQQRDRLQREFNRRVKQAEAKARAEGQAQGRAQGQADARAKRGPGVMDDLERCLANFLVDC